MRPLRIVGLALALSAAGCDAKLKVGQLLPRSVGSVDAQIDRGDSVDVPPDAAPSPDAAPLFDAGCNSVSLSDAGTKRSLLDIVMMIDNSSSMESRMAALLRRLSTDLTKVMESAGVDFRVVLISRYGPIGTHLGESYTPVCMPAPLSADDCTQAGTKPLANNPPQFFHFSAEIDSENALCRLLEVWNTRDELPTGQRPWTPLFPTGIADTLRPAAFKAILVITDDEATCTHGTFKITKGEAAVPAARRFEHALQALSASQFGDDTTRKFAVFSLVGITTSMTDEVLPPSAPLSSTKCSDADQLGALYQALSVDTGGARQSICKITTLVPLFEAMAKLASPACP